MQNNLHFRNSSSSTGEEEEEAVFIFNRTSNSPTDQGEDMHPAPSDTVRIVFVIVLESFEMLERVKTTE